MENEQIYLGIKSKCQSQRQIGKRLSLGCCAGHLLIFYFTDGSGSLPYPPRLPAIIFVRVEKASCLCVAGHKSQCFPLLSRYFWKGKSVLWGHFPCGC